MDVFDVIIIGCGPAGIGAGIEFEKASSNIRYLILEARNRIGGRAHSDRTTFGEETPLDLGAHYLCHHEEENFLRRAYVPSDKDVIESDSYNPTTMKIFDQHGAPVPSDLIERATKSVEELLLTINDFAKEKSDVSISDFVHDHLASVADEGMKRLMNMCLSYTECHEGSDLHELSSKFFGQSEGGLPKSDLAIANGLGTLVETIASKYHLPIRLNSVVINIDASTNTIEVSTRDQQTYRCRYVLLTVPLGCLKSNSITFSPSLPAWKQDAIATMGFGLLNKVYLQFSDRFWDEQLRRITIVQDHSQFYYCLPEYCMLALYVSGCAARELEKKTDEEIVDEVYHSLRRIYPTMPYPIKWLVTRWASDPFSQGSYSSFHVGSGLETVKELSRETHHGRVCWAGEHTNYGGSIGYVDSGFESGIREAKRILHRLRS